MTTRAQPTVETVRAQFTKAGLRVRLDESRSGGVRLFPSAKVTPELLAAARAVKPDLLWQLTAEQRLADLFEELALAAMRGRGPRPAPPSDVEHRHLADLDAAYRAVAEAAP